MAHPEFIRTFAPVKRNKTLIYALYTLLVVCIGLATLIEKYRGTAFVGDHIYGAWWFSALWAVLTVASLAYMLRQRLYKRLAVMLLHLSFVVILAGALTTHLFARRGTIGLRTGIPVSCYIDKEHLVHHLPFSLTLTEFRVINYPGTDAPLDYQSTLQCTPTDAQLSPSSAPSDAQLSPSSARRFCRQDSASHIIVSMNHIGHIDNYRLFQRSYDSDGAGVTLGISYDPYGITITYVGYLLLLIGIIATLLSRKTQMRALYRQAMTIALLALSIQLSGQPAPYGPPAGGKPSPTIVPHRGTTGGPGGHLPSVPADIAHRMGTIPVLYNNRICPLNTVATDFVMKMTGRPTWQGYSADEVFFSWMIYYGPWEKCLAPDPAPAGEGSGNSKDQKQTAERRAIVQMFYSGQFLKIFPAILPASQDSTPLSHGRGAGGEASWFSPGSQVLPREIPVKEQFFIKQSMDFLTEAIVTGQRERAFEIITKIKLFQHHMIGDLLPSSRKIQAELFYNKLRTQKWPVFLALTLSLLFCILTLLKQPSIFHPSSPTRGLQVAFHLSLFLYITLQLALRWWLSGHIPVSNGPETMLFMAWAVLLFTLAPYAPPAGGKQNLEDLNVPHRGTTGGPGGPGGRPSLLRPFSLLIASFCLLVAMLGGSSSQLTPLMPVLQSPLLSIHVMTVMCAYALFALQMLLGIYALINSKPSTLNSQLERATALSKLLLYPAVFLLAIGIFLGAVWANISWGNYWSWDPKESWALITLMVYAVPLHSASIARFRSPRFYHLYIVISFLAVLITYFGVNYLLGGMHSYA